MNAWKEFLDTLNTPGGHILLLCLTVLGMTTGNAYGVPKADDMAIGAFGAFLAILSGKVANVTSSKVTTEVQQTHAPDPPLQTVSDSVKPFDGKHDAA